MILSVKQAAQRLDVSKSLVYALCAEGRLKHYRVGIGRGTIRIAEEDLASVREERSHPPQLLIEADLKHLSLKN
jgi:excisionase family DNA binding protein